MPLSLQSFSVASQINEKASAFFSAIARYQQVCGKKGDYIYTLLHYQHRKWPAQHRKLLHLLTRKVNHSVELPVRPTVIQLDQNLLEPYILFSKLMCGSQPVPDLHGTVS
ncbi:unnamed protein product [Gongylonema pulchrum]|uniref:Transposase n=1 Tax=Gongylonema pulchrum TaxID=637853 RepID=A0A183D7Q1_9BILA|nr:unnamed protein product [Gongylonema pulchrum]